MDGNVLVVVLTGMGQDGLAGIKTLKKAGKTFCITQNEQSCVVYGMSAAIEEANLSDLSVSLEDMAKNITRIIFQNKTAKKLV
jgi:two-component system chemotaxis response regulator CheB